jgi:hypothetical protein
MTIFTVNLRATRVTILLALAILAGCSPKNEDTTNQLASTKWQFVRATGFTTVTLDPSASIYTTTQNLDLANQEPFKTQKLIFFDDSRYGGIVPLSLTGPVASTGTYTVEGKKVRFTFDYKGYRDLPNDTQGLTPDPKHTTAILQATLRSDDELELLQDAPALQEMETLNQPDEAKRAIYVKSTATYIFRRVR